MLFIFFELAKTFDSVCSISSHVTQKIFMNDFIRCLKYIYEVSLTMQRSRGKIFNNFTPYVLLEKIFVNANE